MMSVKRDVKAMAVYRREHPYCEACGWTRHIHVHHMLPLEMGGSNDEDNLVSLCANHHADAHAEMAQFIEIEGHGAKLLVTRHGLVKLLRSIDKVQTNLFENHRRAVNNQRWMKMTKDERDAAVQESLNRTHLSDDEEMILCDLRRGRLKVVAVENAA